MDSFQKSTPYIGVHILRCPHCGFMENKVVESRMNADGSSIRRRRECNECSYRFTSYEKIDEKQLMVIKRDGRREPFDPMKLGRGIERAVEKRPISQNTIAEVLQDIEDQAVMLGKNSHEIDSGDLGELVLKKLYDLDAVAYVRFASVYKMFENVEEFMNEIENFKQTK